MLNNIAWTHSATKDGSWSDPTVWNTGTVPGHNADVNVGNFNVTYDVAPADAKIVRFVKIGGRGSFKFAATQTRLMAYYVECHGYWEEGSWQATIPDSGKVAADGTREPQLEIVFVPLQAPGATVGLGLMTMGGVRINGAVKRMRSTIAGAVADAAVTGVTNDANVAAAGATSVTLTDTPDGWQVGDTIVIGATEDAGTTSTDPQYTGPAEYYGYMPQFGRQTPSRFGNLGYRLSQDEVRVITAINGNTVSFADPLEHDHYAYRSRLPNDEDVTVRPYVGMLSHSIRHRTADASDVYPTDWPVVDDRGTPMGDLSIRQKRAHVMFMFNDDVQARYAEAKNMARTDTDPSLDTDQNTYTLRRIEDADGNSIADPVNVPGRYAWHIHRSGPYFTRKQVVFDGLTAWAPQDEVPIPGWAITQHNSRAAIENCNVYNVRGAGIVSETGAEIGQWLNNCVFWARGDGYGSTWGSRANAVSNHNGHAGIAYENQARQILQTGNIATSCHYGWFYMQQNTNITRRGVPDHALRLRDPVQNIQTQFVYAGVDYSPLNDTYGTEQQQIPLFEHNYSYGCGELFHVSHRREINREEGTPMMMHYCHAINTRTAYHVPEYSWYYSYYDALHIGGRTRGGATVRIGTITWQHQMGNIRCVRVDRAFSDDGIYMNWNVAHFDVVLEDSTEFANKPSVNFNSDPTTHKLYGAMGDWDVTDNGDGTFSAIVDPHTLFDSATDFPLDQKSVNLPKGDLGVTAEPAEMVGAPRPYFWLDPTSDIVCSGDNSLEIKGIIADGIGLRDLGAFQIFYSNGQVIPRSQYRRTNDTLGPDQLVARNGCWNDNGVWKSRLWFVDQDRLAKKYFPFYVDVTVENLSQEAIDKFSQVGPQPEPDLRFLPETQTYDAYVPSTEPPRVIVKNRLVANGKPFEQLIRVDEPMGMWSLGGPDAAHFEITHIAGAPYIQWAGGGSKLHDDVGDADGDNIYTATVSFTDMLGNTGSATFEATLAAPVFDFRDDFDSAAKTSLVDLPGYTLVSGDPTALYVENGSIGQTSGSAHVKGICLARQTGIAMEIQFSNNPSPKFELIFDNGPDNARIGCYYHWSSRLHLYIKDDLNSSKTWVYTNPSGKTVRIELRTDKSLAVFFDEVEVAPLSAPNEGPAIPDGNLIVEDGSGDTSIRTADANKARSSGPAWVRWFVL